MTFFDRISQIKTSHTYQEPAVIEATIPLDLQQHPTITEDICQTDDVNAPTNQPDETRQKQGIAPPPAKTAKPERFSFLPPCPICSGRTYTYGNNGGFFCSSCCPNIQGRSVDATGSARQKAIKAELEVTVIQMAPIRPTFIGADQRNFDAAWPWLISHLPDLLSSGWTRAQLFRRGKYKYPLGPWGIAWSDVWRKEGLAIEISITGEITFIFLTSQKLIKQTLNVVYI